MLRFLMRVSVYKKNEENGARDTDFPTTEETNAVFKDELERLVSGVHLQDGQGNVYVLGVDNIAEIVR